MSNPAPSKEIPPYVCHSFLPGLRGRETGCFHVEELEGRWFAVDPLGRAFVPLGVDHVTFKGHGCEKLGYPPYERHNSATYPSQEAWEVSALERLSAWGFNLLAAGCSRKLFRRGLAHVEYLSLGQRFASRGRDHAILDNREIPGTAFPNVFHPEFASWCADAAAPLASNAGDPWLFGYFLDNELRWWGEFDYEVDTGLFDAVLRLPPEHTARKALLDFLSERYAGDAKALSRAWDTPLDSFEALAGRRRLPTKTAEGLRVKTDFTRLTARRYFEITTGAVRAADPDHMILGCRFAGGIASEVVFEEAGNFCEVVAFNYYGNINLEHGVAMNHRNPWIGPTFREVLDGFHRIVKRPLFLTEWSFPSLESGLPCTRGAGQRFRTQRERVEATAIYAEDMLRCPHLIGYDYFMWVDEPAEGISLVFPEDTNYGLVNIKDEPYAELVDMFSTLHQRSGALRREGFLAPPAATPLRPSEGGGSRGAGPCSVTGDAGALRIESGRWLMECQPGAGSLWENVWFDGRAVGSLRVQLFVSPGGGEVLAQTRLAEVSPENRPGPGGGVTLPLEADLPGGRLRLQIRLDFHPDLDAFLVQVENFVNSGREKVSLSGLAFQSVPATAVARSIRNPRVPRLWEPVLGDAWLEPPGGSWWGLTVPRGAAAEVDFSPTARGTFRPVPGAFWPFRYELPPGGAGLPPGGAPYVVSVAGGDWREGWEKKARAVLEEIALPEAGPPPDVPPMNQGGAGLWA